jgi:hypothetical protein
MQCRGIHDVMAGGMQSPRLRGVEGAERGWKNKRLDEKRRDKNRILQLPPLEGSQHLLLPSIAGPRL